MKRLNPETGKPFVHGEIRADGFLFWKYNLKRIKKDGYYAEDWLSPETAKKEKLKNPVRQAKIDASIKGRAYKLLSAALTRCKKRNKGVVSITQQWIMSKLSQGNCELTGLPFDLTPPLNKLSFNPYSPSLDRIDSNNPDYSPENTRVVLSSVNMAINQFGLDIMLPIFQTLIDQQSHN